MYAFLLNLWFASFLPVLFHFLNLVFGTIIGRYGEVGGGQVDFLLGKLNPFVDHAAYALVLSVGDFQEALLDERNLIIVFSVVLKFVFFVCGVGQIIVHGIGYQVELGLNGRCRREGDGCSFNFI